MATDQRDPARRSLHLDPRDAVVALDIAGRHWLRFHLAPGGTMGARPNS